MRELMNCRQAANGYFCQAPQTPTYNMSTSGASAPGLPSTAGRRHLSQAAPAPAPANQCNQIGYYMTCGEYIDLSFPHGMHAWRVMRSACKSLQRPTNPRFAVEM